MFCSKVLHVNTHVEIEPGNWSKSGRIALVVTGNRSGYPTRNPLKTSRWFGYVPDMKAGREPVGLSAQEPARNVTLVWLCSRHKGWLETGRATRPFSGCFLGGFLVALKLVWKLLEDG